MTAPPCPIPVLFLAGGPIQGTLVRLSAAISPWGGVDPATAAIADATHPQTGCPLADRLVFLPGLKGSTAGPGALLELFAAGLAPRAFITPQPELTLITAVCAARALGLKTPVLALCTSMWAWPEDDTQCCLVDLHSKPPSEAQCR